MTFLMVVITFLMVIILIFLVQIFMEYLPLIYYLYVVKQPFFYL